MITSLGVASLGLLDRGGLPSLHIAAEGLLRDGASSGSGIRRLAESQRVIYMPARVREEVERVEAVATPAVIEAVAVALEEAGETPRERIRVVRETVPIPKGASAAALIRHHDALREALRRMDEEETAILLMMS